MMKSLYSGVAGMKTHNQRMDVIGNNISNVNTTGYKASSVTFKDVYYQTKTNASAGDAVTGGKNPTQIGYGAQLGSVQQVMTQSGFTYTDSYYDCALEGEGFFQVMDSSGNIFYTRSGKFSIDSYGNLCDQNGFMVLGVAGDPTNIETGQSQRINIRIPAVDNNVASATKSVNGYDITISANSFGEEGNISFTIVNSDTPYATKNGQNLTIYMDLDQDFGAEYLSKITDESTDMEKEEAVKNALADFERQLNDAITQGGVGLPEGVLPLDVDFDILPSYDDVQATSASNTLTLSYPASTVDADGNTVNTDSVNNLDITVTARNPGEFANKYEIDFKTTTQSNVTAKWKDDVLTIQIPALITQIPKGLDENGDMQYFDSLEEAIQAAVDAAGSGDRSLDIDVRGYTTDANGNQTGTITPEDADNGFDMTRGLSGTERLGLDNGRDNFFSDIATALSTVTLTDGRSAAEQAVDDLETLRIQNDGTIIGRHAVHGLLYLGRIDIATFENPTGLEQTGTTLWRSSLASGEPTIKIAGKDGAGEVVSGALEMSNVDLAQEFSDMIITQRGYQANSRVITVSDTMLEELVNLKR